MLMEVYGLKPLFIADLMYVDDFFFFFWQLLAESERVRMKKLEEINKTVGALQ